MSLTAAALWPPAAERQERPPAVGSLHREPPLSDIEYYIQ